MVGGRRWHKLCVGHGWCLFLRLRCARLHGWASGRSQRTVRQLVTSMATFELPLSPVGPPNDAPQSQHRRLRPTLTSKSSSERSLGEEKMDLPNHNKKPSLFDYSSWAEPTPPDHRHGFTNPLEQSSHSNEATVSILIVSATKAISCFPDRIFGHCRAT